MFRSPCRGKEREGAFRKLSSVMSLKSGGDEHGLIQVKHHKFLRPDFFAELYNAPNFDWTAML